jgi:hypothetical protein
VTYGPHRVQEEVAYLAFHLHWGLDTLLDLEHADRRSYLEQIDRITARTPPRR